MKTKLIVLLMWAFLSVPAFSQEELKIIKANSELMDIRDGNRFFEKTWTISPELKPDVYTTSSKRVTFYTDLDSISFDVDPAVGEYNFIVLFQGKYAYTQIKYEESYLSKLKKAKEYNSADNRYIPRFTYQSMEDPDLVRIRHELKLDSIAGTGNEISKMINLMYWLHNTVRHDGSSDNPKLRNAIDLIRICREQNRGVNCRMLAIILNECYLAMGFKSRYVTCMPRESQFSDCHVINMVYSTDLNKWVWMDPSFCAYVMDEKGELLGLSEVRERLIDGRMLILNPDANWNRKSSQTKEGYLENYMAKNLYRMEAMSFSHYNAETHSEGKEYIYVQLLPLDGIQQDPQKSTHGSYTNYVTNNPDLFWAKPE